ncbi:MAG: tetratricopeptide repeat protein [Pseudomonadales bacterium]
MSGTAFIRVVLLVAALAPARVAALAAASGGPPLGCDAAALRGDPEADACYRAEARRAGDDALRAEALWRAGDLAGANAAFRSALSRTPDDAGLRARWGRLFIDAHQEADAEALFREALERDADNEQALLGMAQLSLGRFESGVRSHLARVLRRRPDHPEAHLMLARMRLELGEVDTVREDLTRLLDAGLGGWERLDAFALLAAADALAGVEPSPWVERALALNPRFGAVHAVAARQFVINRRYREAVASYERALTVEPDDWLARAELGINLLRVERPADARRNLERAYAGDPYNPLTVNSLRLLDLLDDDFAVVREPGLLVRAPRAQAPALTPYVVRLARRAGADMAARYGYTPAGPVVVELYEHHDDFAVRTAGLPGLGILGATFGDVVVMDGPAAKGIEDGFDWASALWHELAHVYTLGATGNRVSRWFSEGVSVMEEWRHGPTPNRSVPLSFLEALAEDRLLPVADLDEGFLRPQFPQQVGISYVQAGLLCSLIDARFDSGLADMLAVYATGGNSVEAIRTGLGIAPDALDRQFRSYLGERFGGILAALEPFREALRAAHEAAERKDWQSAMDAGRRAVALYPDYVQPDSAYLPLARGAAGLDDPAVLDATLADYFARGGRDPWALDRLADRHAAQGRPREEIAVLEAHARTRPLDGALRARLGERLAAAGRYAEALEHVSVAVELEPHDRAGAQLRLADTYYRLNRIEEARRALLQALEIAPTYGPALDLLLTLNGTAPDERPHE